MEASDGFVVGGLGVEVVVDFDVGDMAVEEIVVNFVGSMDVGGIVDFVDRVVGIVEGNMVGASGAFVVGSMDFGEQG